MNQIKGISTTFCITKKVKDDVKKEFLKSNKSESFTAKEICRSCLNKSKCPFINEKSYHKNYIKNPNFKCDKFYIKACYRTTLTTGINHLNGKIEKKTFSAETKEKSLMDALEYKEQLEKQGGIKLITTANATIVDLAFEYHDRRNKIGEIGDSTINKYEDDLKRLSEEKFAKKPITKVTKMELEEYLNKLKRNYSETVCKEDYMLIRDAYKLAELKGIDVPHYFEGLNKLSRPKSSKTPKTKIKKSLTLDEEQAFVNYLIDVPYYKCKRKDEILFILFSGLRVGEALALDYIQDIDLENKTIFVRKTLTHNRERKTIIGAKTKTLEGIRTFNLTDIAMEYLTKLMNKKIVNTNHLLICNPKKEPLTTNTINSCIKRICEKINIGFEQVLDENGAFTLKNFIHTHTLRATFASRAIEAGVDDNSLQKMMGHTDIATTQKYYIDIDNKQVENATQKMNNYLISQGIKTNQQKEKSNISDTTEKSN